MDHPFRLGTTSYILPDGLVANAMFLAGKVNDMEMVLFDLDDGASNLPSSKTVETLATLASENDLSYTVHLPLDINPDILDGQKHPSIFKAHKTIQATRALNPWAYILHLDGKGVRNQPAPSELKNWQERVMRTLELIGEWAGDLGQLALENLEGYPPAFVQPIVEQMGVARCVDLGHYWLDGIDPLPYLQAALPCTRVIHLHGINGRDHQSISNVPLDKLVPVLQLLQRDHYTGILTMEIFGEEDFHSSYQYLNNVFGNMT